MLAPQTDFAKKVYFQTWGCQMNVADSERMMALLKQRNYVATDEPDAADLIVLNTCHIREKARHKLVSRLGELKPIKETNPNAVLAVSGCVAQAEAKTLANDVPFVDLIFGPDQVEDLPNMLERLATERDYQQVGKEALKLKTHVETGFKKDGYSIPIDVVPPYLEDGKTEVSKYVNIVKGCNNFCTFCVVPYTRGREKSRSQEEVLREVEFFVQNGVKEVVLLGQNVNSYGLDLIEDRKQFKELPFAKLLYAVSEVPQLHRIRFTTSNPHDFTPDLAQAFKDLPKITNQFHLPVQSGANRILDRMNRQYTREEYLERVRWIRDVRPGIAFSTDIIVGFPGETDDEFEQTVDLVQQMKYAFIFAFKYSPRRGTPAMRFKEQVPEDVMDKRLQKLLELQKQETIRQNEAEIGQEREVLVVYRNKREEDSWYGRTYEGRLVKIQTPRDLLGQLVMVKIVNANQTALVGVPV